MKAIINGLRVRMTVWYTSCRDKVWYNRCRRIIYPVCNGKTAVSQRVPVAHQEGVVQV